jgi:hypothetical protein
LRKYVVIYCYDIPKVEKIPGHSKLEFNYSKRSGVNKFLEWETTEGFFGEWVYIANPLYNYDKRYESVGDIKCALFYTKKGVDKYLINEIRHHGHKDIEKRYLVPVYGLFDMFLVHMATRFVLKNYYKFNIYGGWPFVWSAEKYKHKKKINS